MKTLLHKAPNQTQTVPVSEIFYSLQGEGPHIGKPFIFIRFGGCNLQCSWCDTKYTWHPDHIDYKWLDKGAVSDTIQKLRQETGCTNVVFTGGEPAMWQPQMKEIQEAFPECNYDIETNGSIALSGNFRLVVVSPKFTSSGNKPYELKILPAENVVYKFVMSEQEDIEELLEIQAKYSIPSDKIYLMPEGTTNEVLQKRSPWVAELCRQHGFSFTPRLDVLLWDNDRGV